MRNNRLLAAERTAAITDSQVIKVERKEENDS